MFSIEVQVERFIIGSVAKMMADVTLTQEVKWCGEEQRHYDAGGVVETSVREQHSVLGFVDDGINGVHHNPKRHSEQQESGNALDRPGSEYARCNRRKLNDDDASIQHGGDWVSVL